MNILIRYSNAYSWKSLYLKGWCLGCQWSKATGINGWGQLGWTLHSSKGLFKQTLLSWGTDAGLLVEGLVYNCLDLSVCNAALKAHSHHWIVISSKSLVTYYNLQSTGVKRLKWWWMFVMNTTQVSSCYPAVTLTVLINRVISLFCCSRHTNTSLEICLELVKSIALKELYSFFLKKVNAVVNLFFSMDSSLEDTDI